MTNGCHGKATELQASKSHVYSLEIIRKYKKNGNRYTRI